MALQPPIVNQNGSYPASELRRLMTILPAVGVLDDGDLIVTQRGAGANMSVDVALGSVIVENSTASRGRYLCRNTAAANVVVTAAPGGGSSRIDLILATVQDSEYSGAVDTWTLTCLAGTPGTPGTAPAVPAGSVSLAQVAVGSAVASIVTANVTDVRPYARAITYTSRLPSVASNGQAVVASSGLVNIRSAGAWDQQPHRSLFAVATTAVASISAPVAITGSYVTHGSTQIAQPVAGAVNVVATWEGTAICGSGTNGIVSAYMRISIDNGVTWTSGEVSQSTSATVLTPTGISNSYAVSGTPTGIIKTHVYIRFTSGAVNVSGTVTLQITPA